MDPLEDRVRQGLRDDRWRLPADEGMLDRVHVGATRRRRRRTAINVAASVLVLAGLGSTGTYVFTNSDPTNDQSATALEPSDPMLEKAEPGDAGKPELPADEESKPQRKPNRSDDDGEPKSPGGVETMQTEQVPPQFHAVSMTAANTKTFWVLGADPAADDEAVMAKTADAGNSFDVISELPTRVATDDSGQTPSTVAEVRFVDGSNGWAYGGGLWSTHDGGQSWSEVNAVKGSVRWLEAAGGTAYAVVDQNGAYSLWSARADGDSWTQRTVKLSDPAGLAAAQNMVAVTDRTPDETNLVVSSDQGTSFSYRPTPCSPSLDAGSLSATRDSLWLTCPTGTSVSVQVSTDYGENWNAIEPSTSLSNTGMEMGARDASSAVAAAPGEVLQLKSDGSTTTTPVDGLTAPTYVGFTDPSVGYVLDDSGDLFQSTDSGASWHELPIS